MSWNETFYYLAIFAIALTLAQYGISHLSTSLYTLLFKREPNRKVREIIRVLPNFFALITILALALAISAVYLLLYGFANGVSIIIANHWNYLNHTVLVITTTTVFCLLEIIAIFFFFRLLWRLATRLPSKTENSIGDINKEIRERLNKMKTENDKEKH